MLTSQMIQEFVKNHSILQTSHPFPFDKVAKKSQCLRYCAPTPPLRK